jgi:uncharacterized protein
MDGFIWDLGNSEKCKKHGVSLGEVEEVFSFYPLAVYEDPFGEEQRFRAIGRNFAGRYIFVVYTIREIMSETYIRPISARYMHQKETEHYAKAAPSGLQHR